MSLRVLIAGGGTGGHIFPALAIAGALKKMDASMDILFVGAKGKMEMEKVPQAGYSICGLDIVGFDRSSLIKNMALPWKLLKSFWQVRKIIRAFRPDAVLGVGGYSSFPVLRVAQARSIPQNQSAIGTTCNVHLYRCWWAGKILSGSQDLFYR
jgi:UDP-N-acetylglucosamine--N-acetylmuramyl-(pentapeptide) pyrophosphoryl-undecaprenol N-acetylglucosamine transferase